MKKTTEKAINAFVYGDSIKVGNTRVESSGTYSELYLFDNLIAIKDRSKSNLQITNAGWNSATTKERLNGLPGVSISQVKGEWFLNGEAWDGSWKTLNFSDH